MIAYLAGITVPALLPSLMWVLPCLALLLPGILVRRIRIPLLCTLAGLLVASGYGAWQLQHRLNQPSLDLELFGVVETIPEYSRGRISMTLTVRGVATEHEEAAGHLRRVRLSYYDPEERLGAGDWVRARVRVRSPRGLNNPDAFDAERRYLAQGVDARGYVRELLEHRSGARVSPAGLRQRLYDAFHGRFSTQAAATLSAIVLGNRSGFGEAEWQAMRVTGTAHLMVVSGLHVAVVGGFAWLLGRVLGALAARLCGCRKAIRLVPICLTLLLVTIYAWLSGWGLPVQRAWLMMLVFVLGGWKLLQLDVWQRWRWSLMLVLTWQPLAILEPGAWLSFSAVALIIAVVKGRSHRKGWSAWAEGWLKVQLTLFIGMLPLMTLLFQQFNPLAIVINLVAVPLMTLLVWSLPFSVTAAFLSDSLAWALESVLTAFWLVLDWAAQAPGLYLAVPKPSSWAVVLALLLVPVMLLPLGNLYRLLAAAVLLPLIWSPSLQPASGEFEAWVFDVGQGQAILIRTAEGTVLYDTGPGFRGGGAVFMHTVMPYLRARNITRLHSLVLSHDDLDHSGGYDVLRQQLKVKRVLAGEPELRNGSRDCRDHEWQLGQVSFNIMPAFVGQAEARSSNERSCVLSVRSRDCGVLITGDLSVSGEYRLLSAGHIDPHVWLVAGHHGSRDSTSTELLAQVQPEAVLVSAGYGNRFGHPHPEVLERIGHQGSVWHNTADAGAIRLSATADGCSLSQRRKTKKRYWTAG